MKRDFGRILKKNRIIVSIAFVLLVAGLIMFFSVGDMHKVSEGTISIDQDEWNDNNLIKLQGEWAFYKNKLLQPDELNENPQFLEYLQVPGDWNSVMSEKGVGTYSLKVRLPIDKGKLALKMPIISSSSRVFINGDLIGETGKTSDLSEKYRGVWKTGYFPFNTDRPELDVVIQVSNYDHNKGGIAWGIPSIGLEEDVESAFYKSIFLTYFGFGIIFFIFIFNLILYLYKRDNYQALFLALFCLDIGIRLITSDDGLIFRIYQDIPLQYIFKIDHITATLGAIFYMEYTRRDKKSYFFKGKIYDSALLILIIYFLLVVSTDVGVFSNFSIALLSIIVLYSILDLAYTWKKFKDDYKNEMLNFGSRLFLSLAVVNYIFYSRSIMDKQFTIYGILVFMIANSIKLSVNAASSVAELENLSASLDMKIEEKTKEFKKVNEKLFSMATVDSLTQLKNRQYLSYYVKKNNDDISKGFYNSYSVMYIDIDDFKFFNDTYGHDIGDSIIKRFAKGLRDSVDIGNEVFRVGGDEFLIFLPNSPKEEACRVGNRILSRLNNNEFPRNSLKGETRVTCSIGISSISSSDKVGLNELITRADVAMLKSKDFGKNKYYVYE